MAPLAIVGMGCLFPGADGLDAYWSNLKQGVDAITAIPESHWKPSDYFNPDPKMRDMTYGQRGGFLPTVDFSPLEYGITPSALEATDAAQLLGLMVAKRALEDAGYGTSGKEFDRQRASVILGVTGTLQLVIPLGARLGHPLWRKALAESGVPDDVADEVVARIADGYVDWQENSFPGLLGNVVAGRIANRLDLGGTNCVVDAACASSLSAVHLAALELAAGRSDLVVTGGVDTFNDIFMYMCFSKTPALSPSGDARPFAEQADGTVLGEGIGMLVLKRLADARAHGDRIYAILRGLGSSSDGKGNAIYAPSSAGQKQALNRAYALAGVTPDSIEMVEAHGTGTKVGDQTEATALAEVYQTSKRAGTWCSLGSVKSQIGHTKAAAGAAGLIKAALALYHKTIPPTAKVSAPLALLGDNNTPFAVQAEVRPWLASAAYPRRAAVSAFGFGGSNFHAVLEEADSRKPQADWDDRVLVFAFEGKRLDELGRQIEALPAEESWPTLRRLARSSRQIFTGSGAYRLLIVAERDGGKHWPELRTLALDRIRNHDRTERTGKRTPGVYLGEGSAKGRLAMVFPGQGAQYVHMLREWACLFPIVQETLAEAWRDCPQVAEAVFPPHVFSEEARRQQAERLKRTDIAQPALGGISWAAYRVLEQFGVRPDLVAGHSFGELVALTVAGGLEPDTLHRLAAARGKAMADAAAGSTGAMLAVLAPEARIVEVLGPDQSGCVVANRNSPQQIVLSGTVEAITTAERRLSGAGLACRKLEVAAAFHSPQVADAVATFARAVEREDFHPFQRVVHANTTGQAYPADPGAARRMLAHQLASPVEFVAQIEAMAEAGVHTFLEVGPDNKLTGLVDAILAGRGHRAIAVDRRPQGTGPNRSGGLVSLALAMAELAAEGHPVDWRLWDPMDEESASAQAKQPGWSIPLCGANYVKPRPTRPPRVAPPIPTAPGSAGILPATHTKKPASSPTMAGKMPALPAGLPGSGSDALNLHVPSVSAIGEDSRTMSPSVAESVSQVAASNVVEAKANAPLARNLAPSALLNAPSPGVIGDILRMTERSLVAFETMRREVAETQRQFLDSQAAAQRSFQMLVAEQYRLVGQLLGLEGPRPTLPLSELSTEEPKLTAAIFSPPVPTALPTSPAVIAPAPIHKAPIAHRTAPSPAHVVNTASPAEAPAPATLSASTEPADEIGDTAASSSAATLLTIVSEKTGYPAEMLRLDMGLDADLGIDSIKRVEILSAVQEAMPEAPNIPADRLGTFVTLGDIVSHLESCQPKGPQSPQATQSRSALKSPAPTVVHGAMESQQTAETETLVLDTVAEKTGYPAEMLRLDMGLDADLGIDSIKRVEILSAIQEKLPGAAAVPSDRLGALVTLADVVAVFTKRSADTSAASVVPTPKSPSPTASEPAASDIGTALLDIVAEKTGYPAEMLRLDMGLDADLGIDSIKRVEILSAFADRRPDLPSVPADRLGSFATLADLVAHFESQRPTRTVAASAACAPQASNVPTSAPKIAEETPTTLTTAFPVASAWNGERERIELPPEPVLVVDDGTGLAEQVVRLLRAREVDARACAIDNPDLPPALGGLILLAPNSGTSIDWLKRAFTLVRSALLAAVQTNLQSHWLTVSRLDGRFGLARESIADPLSGALAGLLKTARLECAGIAAKALDIDPRLDLITAAQAIVEEFSLVGPVEMGIRPEGRFAITLSTDEASERQPYPVSRGDVVLVTGGGRGVTAAVAQAIAAACQPTLVLLGRTAIAENEPAWLATLQNEREIKAALARQSSSAKTPKAIEQATQAILAAREVRAGLDRLRQTGARVEYRAIDVRQTDHLADHITSIERDLGPIRGIIHGAGVLADRIILDKTDEQWERVVETKLASLAAMLEACRDRDLRLLMIFSSFTARTGRIGQSDYAMANEAINKLAAAEAERRPNCWVRSFNWGPWAGGMVDAGLAKLFASQGVPLIPIEAGARLAVEELALRRRAVEMLVLGPGADWDTIVPEGMPTAAVRPAAWRSVPGAGNLDLVTEFELSVESLPILSSHVLDGRGVVPAALELEWLGHAALHGHPGWQLTGFDDFRIYSGLRLTGPETIRLLAGRGKLRSEGGIAVPVEIHTLSAEGKSRRHVVASAILEERFSTAPAPALAPPTGGDLSVEQAYREWLFHGPALQVLERITGCSATGVAGSSRTSPKPSEWVARPLRSRWITDPSVLDAAFQLLIVWTTNQRGAPSLPTAFTRFRQYRRSFPRERVEVVAMVEQASDSAVRATIEFRDAEGGLVARMEGFEGVIDAGLTRAFAKNQLAQELAS